MSAEQLTKSTTDLAHHQQHQPHYHHQLQPSTNLQRPTLITAATTTTYTHQHPSATAATTTPTLLTKQCTVAPVQQYFYRLD